MTEELDWEAINEQGKLDQPDAIGSTVTSHTKMMLILKVHTDIDPEDALEAGLEAGVLEPDYVQGLSFDGDDSFRDAGRQLRGYRYVGPGEAETQ